MKDSDPNDQTGAEDVVEDKVSQQPASGRADRRYKKSISMHEGIAIWCDCCSCEAEPYWVEIAQEMGIELGSDYEDTHR